MSGRVSLPFLLVGLLLAPPTLSAQLPDTFRSLGSFTGQLATDPHASPDGRFVLLGTNSELRVHNVATKKSVKLADGPAWDLAWSPKLDRIAWVRADADGKGQYVWTMPIDPKTALATGPAQRATIGYSDYPQISPDGKLIAFSAPDSNAPGNGGRSPHHLSVVPATGGPERVVAHFEGGFEGEYWSADGKSLFVAGTPRGLPEATIARVYLDGSAPKIIRHGQREWLAGMTSDHAHLVTVPARNPISPHDSAIVLDTEGNEIGRAALPLGTTNEYDGAIDSALVWVWAVDRRQIQIGGLHGSPAHRISLGESTEWPIWSPDGKRILFQVRERGSNVLASMRADGSDVQIFHDALVRSDWGAEWSPDSKSIGYMSPDGHQFKILNLATRTTRLVHEDAVLRYGRWIWRPDGKSIATVTLSAQGQRSLAEISVDGRQRALFDPSHLISPRSVFAFLDGSTVYIRTDSVAYLVPLAGGNLRRLVEVPGNVQAHATAVSRDGRLVASLTVDQETAKTDQIEIVSIASGERRTLQVPFSLWFASRPEFAEGDKTLLAFGRRTRDTTGVQLFAIPLNGGAPRVVATVTGTSGASVSVAPDGRSIAYAAPGTRTTSLLLVDLRPVLKRSSSSASSRHAPEH